MITGSNGKTTTTNMIARILREAGHTVGRANTLGIHVDDRQIWWGDASGFRGAGWVMTEPRVTAAALETARGSILNHGLYLDRCDVAVLTNIGAEHLGEHGVETGAEMAGVKRRVLDIARRAVVLNADDPQCLRLAGDFAVNRTILFSAGGNGDVLDRHTGAGGRAIALLGQGPAAEIAVRTGGHAERIIPIAEMPAALGGLLGFNIENALAAVGLAAGLDIAHDAIAAGLRAFQLDGTDNPARFMFVEGYPFRVLVNYGSNPVALAKTVPAIADIPVGGRRFCLVTAPDNRADHHYRDMARELAGVFDRYLAYEVPRYVRRHAAGWSPEKIVRGLRANGVQPDKASQHRHLRDALAMVAGDVRDGDLVVVLGENLDETLAPLEAVFGPPALPDAAVTPA